MSESKKVFSLFGGFVLLVAGFAMGMIPGAIQTTQIRQEAHAAEVDAAREIGNLRAAVQSQADLAVKEMELRAQCAEAMAGKAAKK
jgi:hypothetical protein